MVEYYMIDINVCNLLEDLKAFYKEVKTPINTCEVYFHQNIQLPRT